MAVKNTNTSPLLSEGANVTLTESGQVITISAASASPAGTDTQVQFNDGGAFGGDAGLTYNKTTNVLSVESIDFAQTPAAADAERRLKWDNDEGSLALTLRGGNVNIPLGGEVVTLVHNAESFTLTKGTVVYAFGSSGQRVSVKRAVNTSDATSAQTLGVVAEPIATGAEGWVMVQGLVRGLDTSTYTQGDALYLSSSAGQFTKTKQYAPNHLVYVGFAVKINASSGEIFVKCQNGYEMDELHNVSAQSPSNNDILAYNTSTNLWEKKQLSAISGITGSGISGQVAYFNGTNSIASESTLFWDAANDRLGIGSNVPDARLRVAGIFNGVQARFGFTDARGLEISTSLISGTNEAGSILNAKGAGSGTLIFQTESSERIRITSSGNTGINSDGSFGKLSVGSGTGFVGFNVGTSSSPERGNIFFDTDGTGWKMNIGKWQSSAFTSIMTVHDTNNVSVGSASDNGNRFQVSGKISVNTSGQAQTISTRYGANSDGYNTWIGGGGDSAIGSISDTSKGAYNTSYGWNCLLNITEGAYNNGQGVNVLGSLTTGSGNSAFGTSSSVTMSTGYGNSAYGNNSLEKGTTCYFNAAFGNASLYNITTGYQNVGVGFDAGKLVTAGTANQTSTNSVYIGTDSRASSNGNDNEIVIGATSRGNGTNSVTLGNTSITKTVLQGSVCIGNTSTSYKLEVTGDAKVTTGSLGVNVNPNATDGRIDASNDIVAYSSDRRLKENIKDIESPIEKVQKLKGFTYNWNDLANQLAGYNTSESLVGVFAQDVKEVLPEAVKLAPFDNNGHNKSISGEDYLTVQYEKLVPLLIEAIKDLQNQINELKK